MTDIEIVEAAIRELTKGLGLNMSVEVADAWERIKKQLADAPVVLSREQTFEVVKSIFKERGHG